MSSVLEEDRLKRPIETETSRAFLSLGELTTARAGLWPAVALVVSIGLALRGQQLVTQREYPLDGPIFFAAAAVLFLWGVAQRTEVGWVRQISLPLREEWEARRALVANTEYRLWLGVTAVMFSVLAYRGFAGNRFTMIGTTTWLAALLCFMLAVAERPAWEWPARVAGWLRHGPFGVLQDRSFDDVRDRPADTTQARGWTFQVTWVHVALVAITLVAIFFRVYRLADVPAEMTSDHAEKLLDVNDVLHGQYRIFFPRNTGREAVQFYLTAALVRFTPLPIGHLALKVGTALFGIIAVPLTYLLGRELYNREVGLLAATLLAISHWHVSITRVGLRFPFTAAFTVPTLYFAFRAFKYNRRNDWLAAGLILGAGLHTYQAMRVVPLLLVALVIIKLLVDVAGELRDRYVRGVDAAIPDYPEASSLTHRFWENALLSGLACVLVFLPLLRYMRDQPEMFWYRVLTRSSDLERSMPADTWHTFLGNVKNALLMFNYRGDVVWVNTVPFAPDLGLVTASLFVLGVAYLLWRLVEYGDRRTLYVLVALFMMLLPSILSLAFPDENPSVVRAGGAVPIATLIAALPLCVIAQRLRAYFGRPGMLLGGVLTAGLLIVAVRFNYNLYFVKYDQQFRESAWNSTEMGQVVRGFADSVGDLQHAYHVSYPHWVDTRNIGINAGDVTWENAILDPQQIRDQASDPAPKLYLVYPPDQASLSLLQSVYPRGQLTLHESKTPGKEFYVFFVPGGNSP